MEKQYVELESIRRIACILIVFLHLSEAKINQILNNYLINNKLISLAIAALIFIYLLLNNNHSFNIVIYILLSLLIVCIISCPSGILNRLLQYFDVIRGQTERNLKSSIPLSKD